MDGVECGNELCTRMRFFSVLDRQHIDKGLWGNLMMEEGEWLGRGEQLRLRLVGSQVWCVDKDYSNLEEEWPPKDQTKLVYVPFSSLYTNLGY